MAVYQIEYYKLFKLLGIKDKISIEDFLDITKKEYFFGKVELFFMGRATYSLKELFPTYPAHTFFKTACQPLFLRGWHNHFDNYANYIPGYCGGISLGNCRDLDKLCDEGIETEEYPILNFLINEDLKGLFQFAQDFGYRESHDGYFSKCHLCTDMRKHLVSRKHFRELTPEEFYLHLE